MCMEAIRTSPQPKRSVPRAPCWVPVPCPYLGLPRSHFPRPCCPQCHTAALPWIPLTGSLAGEQCCWACPELAPQILAAECGHRGTRRHPEAMGTRQCHHQDPALQCSKVLPSLRRATGSGEGSTNPSNWAPPHNLASGCSPAPRRWLLRWHLWFYQGLKERPERIKCHGDRGWHQGHPLPAFRATP